MHYGNEIAGELVDIGVLFVAAVIVFDEIARAENRVSALQILRKIGDFTPCLAVDVNALSASAIFARQRVVL